MINDVILTLEDISCLYGDRTIIKDASLGIHVGDKIGILGVNGSGKTTLLKILSGVQRPNTGKITLRKDLKIGYLEQDVDFLPHLTVLQHTIPLEGEVQEDYYYKALLNRLGISNYDQLVGTLSGGQRRKADLARVLAMEPDLLVLDEPTNHLDLDTIEWLQNYLITSNKAVLFVTHDRYFLDAISTRIIEIERAKLYFF
ncbi:MAG: ATP-binding cassette domain-containing protein, partial [Candidatus Cloacimonetes bacterium]|nr:ATP-binding cassette domain-containing protein [Candidatus Cloacimonadota bacterium]